MNKALHSLSAEPKTDLYSISEVFVPEAGYQKCLIHNLRNKPLPLGQNTSLI